MGICARGSEDLNRTVGELRDHGVAAYGVLADVGQDGDVERFVAEAAAELGRVDLLVANVGPNAGERGFLASTPEDWRQTFELNVGHTARTIRACVPHMQQAGGGAVIIIASISGWKPAPYPQYGAAKAAEIYLAMELGRELAPERIRVNAVSPGSSCRLAVTGIPSTIGLPSASRGSSSGTSRSAVSVRPRMSRMW